MRRYHGCTTHAAPLVVRLRFVGTKWSELVVAEMRRCGEKKWGNGWHKVVDAKALWKDIRFTSERHLSTLCCRREKIIVIVGMG